MSTAGALVSNLLSILFVECVLFPGSMVRLATRYPFVPFLGGILLSKTAFSVFFSLVRVCFRDRLRESRL